MNNNKYDDLYFEAVADLERLEAEADNLRRLCSYLKGKMGQEEQCELPEKSLIATGGRRFADCKQVDAAHVVLSEATEPLKTREIAKRLIDGGFPSKDMRKLKTSLFTTMTRKADIFEKAGAGLWKLKASDR